MPFTRLYHRSKSSNQRLKVFRQPGGFIWLDTKMLYKWDLAQVKPLVGKDLWDKAYAEGVNMQLDQAVALAMKAWRIT